MPYDRVIEMFCDFVAAGKAYEKSEWTPKNPYNYWLEKCKNQRAMHVDSEHLLETLLKKLSDLNDLDKFDISLNSGEALLLSKYECSKHDSIVLETIITQLKTIENSYPKHLKILILEN